MDRSHVGFVGSRLCVRIKRITYFCSLNRVVEVSAGHGIQHFKQL